MPLQNRVRPDGDIVACESRGLLMGNRGGRLHDDAQRLGERRWTSKAWICCRTSFKDRRRQVMGCGYTELFFLDEATALAAGHRPCFECRRADAIHFAELWNVVQGRTGRARAGEIDDVLHRQRLTANGNKRVYRSRQADLPDGAMVAADGVIALWIGGQLRPWTPAGYTEPIARPTGFEVDVLTPPATVAVLGAGYHPVLDSTSGA